jgi:hypothetical protein
MTKTNRPIPALPMSRLIAAQDTSGRITFDPTAMPTIRDADVILGRDKNTGKDFVVFGRDVLARLAEVKGAERQKVTVIEVDPKNPMELDVLVALVTSLKGSNDYRPREEHGNLPSAEQSSASAIESLPPKEGPETAS